MGFQIKRNHVPKKISNASRKKNRSHAQIMCQQQKRQTAAFGRELLAHHRHLECRPFVILKSACRTQRRSKHEGLKSLPGRRGQYRFGIVIMGMKIGLGRERPDIFTGEFQGLAPPAPHAPAKGFRIMFPETHLAVIDQKASEDVHLLRRVFQFELFDAFLHGLVHSAPSFSISKINCLR